jgi:hypothetical protein
MSHSSTAQSKSEGRLSDAEEGEKQKEDGQPKPVGFWHRDLNHVRKSLVLQWARTGLVGRWENTYLSCTNITWLTHSVLILCTRSIVHSISVLGCVVQSSREAVGSRRGPWSAFDNAPQPLVGQAVTQATGMQSKSPMPHLGFATRSPSEHNDDPIAVRQDVFDEHMWAVIIVIWNATSL